MRDRRRPDLIAEHAFRREINALHGLGPRVTGELIAELVHRHGPEVRSTMATFAALDIETECATCPAGWSEGRGAYLREHHPDLAARYAGYLKIHAAETAPVVDQFFAEWRALGLDQVTTVQPAPD